MNEIYFEIPASTHETKVSITNGEELWMFDIVFFESELSDLRMVTVSGPNVGDQLDGTQTFRAPMKNYDRNEFEFEFEPISGKIVNFDINETREYRIICVRW